MSSTKQASQPRAAVVAYGTKVALSYFREKRSLYDCDISYQTAPALYRLQLLLQRSFLLLSDLSQLRSGYI